MSPFIDHVIAAVVVGAGATATMDLWSVIRQRVLGITPLSYALVGRWLAHLLRGRFRHDPIAASPQVRHERVIGWSAHYVIGIVFASMLLGLCGIEWTCRPTLVPALTVGLVSVLAPFLILQPGMGAGIAASRTSRPNASRLQSLMTHAVFGLGLYAAGWVGNLLGVFRCDH